MLGLTKAEACRLTKGLVRQTPPSSFVTGGHRCSQKSRPRRAATGGKRSSGSAKAKQAKKVPKATPQQCEWPCSLCSAVFVASNKAQLTKKRDNHIVREHAQVDRSLFTTLRGTMGASHKSKPGKGCRRDRQGRWMWTCNVCSDTSKHASKASLRSLRAHHIKTVHPTVCGSSFTTINGNPGRRTRFDHGELRQILMHTPSRRKLLEDPLPRFELVQTDVAPTLSAMATLRPIPARRLRHKPLGFLLAMPMAMLTATMHWTSRRPSVLTSSACRR